MLQDSDRPNSVKSIVSEGQSFGISDTERLVVVVLDVFTEICSCVIIHNILKRPATTADFQTTCMLQLKFVNESDEFSRGKVIVVRKTVGVL